MLLEYFPHMIVEDRDDQIMGGGRELASLEQKDAHTSGFGDIVSDTPLTSAGAACQTEAEAASFLQRAVAWALATGRRITLSRLASAQDGAR